MLCADTKIELKEKTSNKMGQKKLKRSVHAMVIFLSSFDLLSCYLKENISNQ